jgi:hypothetical protein
MFIKRSIGKKKRGVGVGGETSGNCVVVKMVTGCLINGIDVL